MWLPEDPLMAMELPVLDAAAPAPAVVAALRTAGAAVVTDLLDVDAVDLCAEEMRSEFDQRGRQQENDFNGYRTLRISSVLGYAPAAARMVGHPLVLDVADAVLLPHCLAYRIGSATGIEILPGESDQVLHRDDTIYPIRIPGMEFQIGVMWAIDDFTEENGATRVALGSHRLTDHDGPALSCVVQASMLRGSALFYMGSLWHGGGANRSNGPRMGLINTYALGWLRQEVNQYLAVPPEVAARYDKTIRRLLGYAKHGDILGYGHRIGASRIMGEPEGELDNGLDVWVWD